MAYNTCIIKQLKVLANPSEGANYIYNDFTVIGLRKYCSLRLSVSAEKITLNTENWKIGRVTSLAPAMKAQFAALHLQIAYIRVSHF